MSESSAVPAPPTVDVRCLEILRAADGSELACSGSELHDEWVHYAFESAAGAEDGVVVEVLAELDPLGGEWRDPSPDESLPTINIRNLSLRCAGCGYYPTLAGYEPGAGSNRYTFECESGCDPSHGRIWVDVDRDLDDFARRDPAWRGGGRHGEMGDGAESG